MASLTSLGLLGREGSAPAALAEVTEALHEALGSAEHGGGDPDRREDRAGTNDAVSAANAGAAGPPRASGEPADTGSWYSPALTAVGQGFEILRALRDRPGRINRNGTTSVATIRGIADATGISAEDARRALEELRLAGLTAAVAAEQALVVSAEAEPWAALPHAARWIAIADGVLGSAGRALRTSIDRRIGSATHGVDLGAAIAELPYRFPLLPAADLAAADAFSDLAEHLGLAVDGWFSPPALALLAGERDRATALLRDQLPAPAPGVYVQPDLSVVLPGPLDPADELALARLARPEHIGVASTRRISEASLVEAFDRGWTADSARALFERLSLTGIPQPLDYLLSSLGARMGDIVVSDHHGDAGRTIVAVSRPDLAEMLLVDRGLQHLQLGRTSDPGAPSPVMLVSRLRAEHVLAALGDARYPAVRGDASRRDPAEAAEGRPETAAVPVPAPEPQGTVAPAASGTPDAATGPDGLPTELSDLIERVHRAARADPGAGDFTRRLELAIRDRSAVSVTAEASGQRRTFQLLPVSLSGGRLRATDQAAGVERTLPVNLIVAVDPV
ncbi:hypothetical protein D3248_02970 [Leucobacter zeae]|nr:hypothetical protein [Leucobacter zeae]